VQTAGYVLPASKRPARFYEPTQKERPSGAAPKAPPASNRRGAAAARDGDIVDDDPTLLFSGSISSILPPRPDKPISQPPIAKAPPLPNLRGGLRGSHRPESERPQADPEDRTILRPVPGDLLPRRSPIPPAAPTEADRKTSRNSDVGDPPSTVNTAKVRIVRASKQSATAALVAVGAFVGLVIAMIARGDANSVLDATASMIDPSHAAAGKAPAAPVRFTLQQQTLDVPPKPMPAGSETSSNAGACSAVTDPVSPTVAPIVISAAAPHQASPPRVEPPSTPRASAPAVVAAAPAHATSKPGGGSQAAAHEAAPSHGARTAKSAPADLESAAAADALAKAQLEASLR
jgi:hypothetical protein